MATTNCTVLRLCNHLKSFFSNRKCGQRPPSNPLEVTSSGNIMLINLITDSEVQRPGFSAMYLAIPKSKGRRAYESLVFIHPHVFIPALLIVFFSSFFSVIKCNATLTADKGVITSPLHPSFYPPAVDCKWTIKVCPPSSPPILPSPAPPFFSIREALRQHSGSQAVQ